jgi:integrase
MSPVTIQDTDPLSGGDRPKIPSGKVFGLGAGLDPADDSLALWVGRYLDLAVAGVRSVEVAGKIARHVGRFHAWFAAGYGHDRISAVTLREVAAWRDHLAGSGATNRDGSVAPMAPATVNNHLAHLSAMFTWIRTHAPAGLLVHGDPTKGVDPLPLPAPEPRALNDAQVRTVKNVLDRIEGFHRLTGRAHRATGQTPAVHAHARPLRDRAITHLMLGTGLRRAEVAGLDLAQLEPAAPNELRRVKRARLTGVRGKGRTTRTVFLGLDTRAALADYLERERPADADALSEALFLAAASIATRRPGGALSPRSINTIVGEIGRLHDLQVDDPERQLDTLRPHDLRHSFAYRLSAASGHNRAELERRLGHANDRYLRLYTNPPDEIAAGFVEHL